MAQNRKIYNSDICIDGKRISEMREIVNATFGEAFMYIEVDTANRVFIVRIDDSVGNGIDITKLIKFEEKYRLCKVRVYQELDMMSIKASRKK